MRVSVVVGNPKPRSRTLLVAEAVAATIADATSAEVDETVDLCDHAADLFRWPHRPLAAIAESVALSDYVVFASPTYKGAYTGLLKAFLDRYAANGLVGAVAIPVMTGSSSGHSLAIETALRPVLVELGACLPCRGLYFVISRMAELENVVSEWGAANLEMLARSGRRAAG